MRISDWSSDVCSSDLILNARFMALRGVWMGGCAGFPPGKNFRLSPTRHFAFQKRRSPCGAVSSSSIPISTRNRWKLISATRSEEHTSELQSLMRNSYAVFCLKKKNTKYKTTTPTHDTFLHLRI